MKKTNTKPLPSTAKRSNFDQVAAGVCPHDKGKLGEGIRGSGVGVTRTCEKCQHRWYINRKIRTTKCQTCATDKRKASIVPSVVDVEDVTSNSGGSVWESNPPETLLMPHNGFEVRGAHRDSYAPNTKPSIFDGKTY